VVEDRQDAILLGCSCDEGAHWGISAIVAIGAGDADLLVYLS
jgi:hypothetical protein